jgi:hypothetical protein
MGNEHDQSVDTSSANETPAQEPVANTETTTADQETATPAVSPVTEQIALAPSPVSVPADTVTLATPTTLEPVAVAETITVADDEHVQTLKIQLAAFSKAVMRPGKKPEDFRNAATLAVQITKHVIQYPKVPVLDALLDFFRDNMDGVCAPTNFMKGSTTVGHSDERQVGYLYNLFSDLANKTVVRISNAQVINVLKKPEIAEYFNRKMAGIRQAAELQE